MTDFYDAAIWSHLPSPGTDLMLYQDGEFAVPPDAIRELRPARWHGITVTGDPAWGAIDWEPRNPCFTGAGLRGYVRGRLGRRRAGEVSTRARVYVEMHQAREALGQLGYRDGLEWFRQPPLVSYPLWWIPTLDGKLRTPEELAAELAGIWDAPIPVSALWGQQYTQLPEIGPVATVDVSRLFGEW